MSNINREEITKNIASVRNQFENIYLLLTDGLNSSFINELSKYWACEDAKRYFSKGYDPNINSLLSLIENRCINVLDNIGDGLIEYCKNNDISITEMGFSENTRYINFDINIGDSIIKSDTIKNSIDNNIGIDYDKALNVLDVLVDVTSDIVVSFEKITSIIENMDYISSDDKSRILLYVNSLKAFVVETLEFIYCDCEYSFNITRSRYGDNLILDRDKLREENEAYRNALLMMFKKHDREFRENEDNKRIDNESIKRKHSEYRQKLFNIIESVNESNAISKRISSESIIKKHEEIKERLNELINENLRLKERTNGDSISKEDILKKHGDIRRKLISVLDSHEKKSDEEYDHGDLLAEFDSLVISVEKYNKREERKKETLKMRNSARKKLDEIIEKNSALVNTLIESREKENNSLRNRNDSKNRLQELFSVIENNRKISNDFTSEYGDA